MSNNKLKIWLCKFYKQVSSDKQQLQINRTISPGAHMLKIFTKKESLSTSGALKILKVIAVSK